jgi:hypothetical protein
VLRTVGGNGEEKEKEDEDKKEKEGVKSIMYKRLWEPMT